MDNVAAGIDRSLLIVEDDKSFLQRLARAMESRGFTGGMAKPSRFGSASVSGPASPLPRKTTTNRCPLPG